MLYTVCDGLLMSAMEPAICVANIILTAKLIKFCNIKIFAVDFLQSNARHATSLVFDSPTTKLICIMLKPANCLQLLTKARKQHP